MKKWLTKIGRVLEELTYFVPDFFLGLTILSAFQPNIIITICLLMVYIALVLAERFYHKLRLSKEITKVTVDQVNAIIGDFEKQINDKQFITMAGLMKFAEIVDDDVNGKIDSLKTELSKGDAVIEVDKKEQRQNKR